MAWIEEPEEDGYFWWRIENTSITGIGRIFTTEDDTYAQLYGLTINAPIKDALAAVEWWDEPIKPPDN